MSNACPASACPVKKLTGSYVSSGNNLPPIATTTLTVRSAPGKAATGTSKWTGKDGKSHFGEFQGQVKSMSDGQSAAKSVWFGTCRLDGGNVDYPFVLVASDDGTKLQGAYWNESEVSGTWDFTATT